MDNATRHLANELRDVFELGLKVLGRISAEPATEERIGVECAAEARNVSAQVMAAEFTPWTGLVEKASHPTGRYGDNLQEQKATPPLYGDLMAEASKHLPPKLWDELRALNDGFIKNAAEQAELRDEIRVLQDDKRAKDAVIVAVTHERDEAHRAVGYHNAACVAKTNARTRIGDRADMLATLSPAEAINFLAAVVCDQENELAELRSVNHRNVLLASDVERLQKEVNAVQRNYSEAADAALHEADGLRAQLHAAAVEIEGLNDEVAKAGIAKAHADARAIGYVDESKRLEHIERQYGALYDDAVRLLRRYETDGNVLPHLWDDKGTQYVLELFVHTAGTAFDLLSLHAKAPEENARFRELVEQANFARDVAAAGKEGVEALRNSLCTPADTINLLARALRDANGQLQHVKREEAKARQTADALRQAGHFGDFAGVKLEPTHVVMRSKPKTAGEQVTEYRAGLLKDALTLGDKKAGWTAEQLYTVTDHGYAVNAVVPGEA